MLIRVLLLSCLLVAAFSSKIKLDSVLDNVDYDDLDRNLEKEQQQEGENLVAVQNKATSGNVPTVHPLLTNIVSSEIHLRRVGQLILVQFTLAEHVHILTIRAGVGLANTLVNRIFGWVPRYGQLKAFGHVSYFNIQGPGFHRKVVISPQVQKFLNILLSLKWRIISRHTALLRKGHCVLVYRKDFNGALILNRQVCYGKVANLARYLTGHSSQVDVVSRKKGFVVQRNGRKLKATISKGKALIRILNLLKIPDNQRYLDLILSGTVFYVHRQLQTQAGQIGNLEIQLAPNYGLNTVIIKGGSTCDRQFEAEFGSILPGLIGYNIARIGNQWHVRATAKGTEVVNRFVPYRKSQIVVLKRCLSGMVPATKRGWTNSAYVIWKRGPRVFVRHGPRVIRLTHGTPVYYRVTTLLHKSNQRRIVLYRNGAKYRVLPKNHLLQMVIKAYNAQYSKPRYV